MTHDNEYPLSSDARYWCPTARYVGGTSRYLCECPEPETCPGVRTERDGDRTAAHELALYAVNEAHLYENGALPILRLLAKKRRAAPYRHARALVLWERHAKEAAKAYGREFGTAWPSVFTVPTRRLAAAEIADHYYELLADMVDGRA